MITKHLKFRDLYNSNTLNSKDSYIFGANGVISGGEVTVSGLVATIAPIVFVQGGLIVQSDTAVTVSLNAGILSRPHFLAVSVENDVQSTTEVLGTTIVARPEDFNDLTCIVAEWDGNSYRSLPLLSLNSIIQYEAQNAIDDSLVGIKSGFIVSNTSGSNYTITAGTLRDKTGRTITTNNAVTFTQNSIDPDYPNRIDQVVFRTPLDSSLRVGQVEYFPGDAIITTGQNTTKAAVPAVSNKQKSYVKIFSPSLVAGHEFLFLDDYAASEQLQMGKYSTDISTQETIGATPGLLAPMGNFDAYDAVTDANGNIYFIAESAVNPGSLHINAFTSSGVAILSSDVVFSEAGPCTDFRIFIDTLQSVLYMFWRVNNSGLYSIRYASTNLNGASITSPVTLLALGGGQSIDSYDISVLTDDEAIWLTYAVTGVVHLQKYNLTSGNSQTAPTLFTDFGVISGNTALQSNTAISGAATNPRVRVGGNKEVFVFWQQLYDGTNRDVAIWNTNYASTLGFSSYIPNSSPSGDVANFNVCLNEINDVYIAAVRGAVGAQALSVRKIDLYTFNQDFVTAIETNYSIDGIDIKKNLYGVIMLGYISRPMAVGPQANGSPQDVAAFGPGAYNGQNVTQQQFIIPKVNVDSLPRPVQAGDTFLVNGAGANNAATGIIISSSVVTVLSVQYYIFLTNVNFTYQTGSIATQFSYESGGDEVKIVKSVAASGNDDWLSIKELDSDVWLGRIRVRNTSPITTGYNDLFNRFDAIGANQNIRNLYDYIFMDVTGGGAISFNTPNTFAWTGTINIVPYGREDYHTIAANSFAILPNQLLYVTLPEHPDSAVPLTPIVIDANRFAPDRLGERDLVIVYNRGNRLYSRFAPFHLDLGEQASSGFGQTVSDELLQFIGATSDVDNAPAYTSTHYVSIGDSLVHAISELDAELNFLATQNPGEDVFYIMANTNTITAPTQTWINDNTIPDLTVWKNGQKLQQELTATILNPSTTEDYRKTSTTSLIFADVLVPGDKIVVRKENAAGASGGDNFVKQNNVNVVNNVNKFNFTGAGWSVTDAGSGQANIGFSGGSASNFTKSVYNNSGATINPGLPLAWAADGSVVLAENDIVMDTDFAGISVGSIPNASFGLAYKAGNVAGILTGLGATPGQPVFLGGTPGSYSLTAPGAQYAVIKIGKAEPADGVFSASANDLFIEFEIISQPS